MHRPGISRGLHPDRVVHVLRVLRPHREFPAGNPHHAVGRRPGRRILVLDGRKKSIRRRRFGRRRAWLADGLGRVAVKATIAAAAIVTTATHVHALLLRRGTDTVLFGFERRLLICGLGRVVTRILAAVAVCVGEKNYARGYPKNYLVVTAEPQLARYLRHVVFRVPSSRTFALLRLRHRNENAGAG